MSYVSQLRGELHAAQKEIEKLCLERNQLNAQVRNLRAALEEISINYPDPSPAGMIARAALVEEEKK